MLTKKSFLTTDSVAASPCQRRNSERPSPASRLTRAPNFQTATSLVDTAAAIVALSLLAFCLVPALGGVARSSKNGQCLSNLMRIGYANAIYAAQDAADMALPVHPKQFQQCPGLPPGELCDQPIFVGAYDWGGKSGVGKDDFVTGSAGDPLNSRYGSKAGFGPPTRPLNHILYPGPFADAFSDQGFDSVQALVDTQLD